MSHLFITGVAGFVGAALARRALELGWRVSGIDLVPRSAASRLQGLALTYMWGSLQDLEALPHSIEYVVHAAAVADVPFALGSPGYTLQQNVLGTMNLCRRLCDIGPARVVVQSSESVYGGRHAPAGARIPEDTPLEPVNIYGASKAAQEMVALSYYHASDLPVVVVRSSTLFGPGMRENQVVPIFLRQALAGEPLTVHGDGRQSRDLNYIDNLVDGIFLALTAPSIEGKVFNVAGDNEVSVLELARACIQVTGSASQVVHTEQRPGEQGVRLVPDIRRAREVLGYAPAVSLPEGLQRTADWMTHRSPQVARV